jgi:biotin carboxyl carrier protein
VLDGTEKHVDVLFDSAERGHILMDNKSYTTEVLDYNKDSKVARVKVNGKVYTITVKDRFDDLLQQLGMENAGIKKVKDIKAPMPGLVLEIMVSSGQAVQKDSPLLILEAMKMENVIKSPAEGVIKKVITTKGIAVEKNAVLIEFE